MEGSRRQQHSDDNVVNIKLYKNENSDLNLQNPWMVGMFGRDDNDFSSDQYQFHYYDNVDFNMQDSWLVRM